MTEKFNNKRGLIISVLLMTIILLSACGSSLNETKENTEETKKGST